LVIVARGGATIAYVQGPSLQIIRDEDSYVPSKHKMGGQSQRRFQRLADEAAAAWYNKVAEMINKIFLEDYPVEAIVVGGPALSKGEFIESKALDYRIKEKIIGVYDVGYTGSAGIRELLERAKNELSDFEIIKERNLMQRFMEHLGKDTGLAIYGEHEVFDALDKSAVDVVLVSEAVDRVNLDIHCDNCDYQKVETVKSSQYNDFVRTLSEKSCPKCGETKLYIENETDLVEELNEQAEKTGATLEIISTSHEDGAMLYNVFGGIAAILRYRLYES
ncbi:MAG: peptide chain release factor aRF-1, partial [Candidatus Heimdallarchaeaceae archaeon]